MKRRPEDAEIQGYFCPVQRAELVERRLRSGKCAMTDVGLEKRCPKCTLFWPMDTEFWFASKTEDGLFSWCRACYTKHRWPQRGNAEWHAASPEFASLMGAVAPELRAVE